MLSTFFVKYISNISTLKANMPAGKLYIIAEIFPENKLPSKIFTTKLRKVKNSCQGKTDLVCLLKQKLIEFLFPG